MTSFVRSALPLVPAACSLTATDGRAQLTAWRRFDEAFAQGRDDADGVLTIHYARTEESVAELRRLVDVESRCCSFVRWDIRDAGDTLALVVTGDADQLRMLSI
ncbi:hypothetical protein NVV95_17760 [Herbiconiux sp. CPCC 205716]|uniref:Uncharacterized protein n=1 Tax=Herbiconiux gentiana TaxID=2970912 RepID=A0ABT2GJJ3_9MICO|nr:hypothetical protein [Herbiconiux gentiana]